MTLGWSPALVTAARLGLALPSLRIDQDATEHARRPRPLGRRGEIAIVRTVVWEPPTCPCRNCSGRPS